jgi:hypothetical protein
MGSQQANVDNVSAHAFKIVVTYADQSDTRVSQGTEGS